MGVSIYVMPFTRYLTGRFKTTWETRAETAGTPGFRITPEGVADVPESNGRSSAEAAAWLERFQAALRERYVDPAWEDEGDVLHAGTLSYSSFGYLAGLVGRFAGRARFPNMVDPLCPYWIPSRFPRPLNLPDPDGGDEPIKVLSSIEAREELTRLEDLRREDPRELEIRALPDGTILSGGLAEFEDEGRVLRHVLRAATLSVDHRVPVIIEA